MLPRTHQIGLGIAGVLLPAVARAQDLYSLPNPLSGAGGAEWEVQAPMPVQHLPLFAFIWDSAYGIGYKLIAVLVMLVGVGLFAAYSYGAFLWMTSLGGEQTKKAKTVIIEATVGLVVVLLSYALVRAVINLRN